ncbi:BON domain-containing protein [Caballeronia sp. BR00000012568055]|uniref:BON domain-containing protein n=1 Tax=Caballeronia sp. BR00000012568055 TaxID=2918761 RepID=UPI0023F72178|nr:BON domain-containing protein [Caballeronia sp. BR00000012568055]
MKTTLGFKLASGALVALISFGAYAQESDAALASSPANASSPSNAKAMKAANRALQKQVVRALSTTKGLRSSAITVRANSGAVILEGTVPEQSQTELAARAAAGVPGVTSVKNMLTLSTL